MTKVSEGFEKKVRKATSNRKVIMVSNEEIVHLAIAGVSIEQIDLLSSRFGLRRSQIARFIGVDEKTIGNYRKQNKRFDPRQSEQLLKIERLMEKGAETFGDKDAFQRWLIKPAYGLNNEVPENFLVTSEGINMILDEVERIAHGDLA